MSGSIPEWDLADRMRKAMRHAGMGGRGISEMAGYIGVTRGTISNWINGRWPPQPAAVRLWALRCGVSYEWLTGTENVADLTPARAGRRSR